MTPAAERSVPWGRQRWVLALAVALYIAMRVYHGAAICLDGDEIFSVGSAIQDWAGMMHAIGRDAIHPPLFYWLLKLWIAIGGDSLRWVRLLPALFSTLAIVPMVLLGRALRLRPVAISTAVGLAAVHPFLIYYAQHVRMYSLLMLLALTSLWLFARGLQRGMPIAALTAANIAMVYVQNYGWLVIALECAYALLWRREQVKRLVVSGALVLLAFTPWIWWDGRFILAKGGLASNLAWIERPNAGALAWCFVNLSGFGDFPSIGRQAVAALAVLVLAAGYAAWRQRAGLGAGHFIHVARFLLFFLLASIFVAFTASWLLPSSVWGQRHITYLAVAILMLVSAAYWQLNAPAVRITGGVLCAFWAIMSIAHQVRGDDKKTPFDRLVVEMLAAEAGNSQPFPFYSVDPYLHYPIWFYLETLKKQRATGFATPLPADRKRLAEEAARIEVRHDTPLDRVRGDHFWIGYGSAWTGKQTPEVILQARGCRTGADITVRDRYHTSTIFPVWCGGQQ